MEFLSTVEINPDLNSLRFRLRGEVRKVTRSVMSKLFGFHASGIRSVEVAFNCNEAWTNLTGFHNWHSGGMSNGYIKNPVLAILHKFLAYSISGNAEGNKVNRSELFLLDCVMKQRKVCATSFLLNTLKTVLKNSRCNPTLPLVVTVLACHFKLISPNSLRPPGEIFMLSIGFNELKKAHLVTRYKMWEIHTRRPCVKNHMNALAMAEANVIRDRDDDMAEPDQEENEAEPEVPTRIDAMGMPGGSHSHATASTSSAEYNQLQADLRDLQDDLGKFQIVVYDRLDVLDRRVGAQTIFQDYMEQRLDAIHSLLTEQSRLWHTTQQQQALHYTDHSSTPPPDV